MKTSPLRKLAAACIVAAGVCFVIGLYATFLTDKNASQRDFISYWAAGHQLVHGADPYDLGAVQALEITVGRTADLPVLAMRNPPIAFFLVWPLGLFGPKISLVIWLMVLLAGLSISIWVLWLIYGQANTRLHLFGYAFAPAIACLMAGQFGIFLLVGVALFLKFHKSQPYLAGAALLLCVLKPHLFLPFGIVLILFAVTRGNYRIPAGFAAAFLASCALSFGLDRQAWSQYSAMMHAGGALDEAIPALSVRFRFLISPHTVWLQFVPEVAACIWAVWFFWTRRDRWNWLDHGLLLLLVSAMCAPYAFFTDESMLLPAVLAGLYQATGARRSMLPLALFAGASLIEVLANVQIISMYFLWTTPAWLCWYLYATGRIGGRTKDVRVEGAVPEQARG